MGVVGVELMGKLKAAAAQGTTSHLAQGRDAAGCATAARRQARRFEKRRGPGPWPSDIHRRPGDIAGGVAALPADLPASLFLVQHMPPSFMASFARRLDEHCALKVVEAVSGMKVEPGVCYVAPGAMQLCLHRKLGARW